MTEKDLTPEQHKEMKTLMAECRCAVRNACLAALLWCLILGSANMCIGTYLQLTKDNILIINTLTGLLLGSSLYRRLLDISDEFVAEGQEILKKKE